MFKVSLNRAVLQYRLETVTPLSIRAGDTGLDPTAASLVCVRTHHRPLGPTVYVPGSSFKGVIRAAAEASVRGQTFGGELEVEGACDPGDHRTSCARHGRRGAGGSPDTALVHRRNCLACRLFGSLSMRGRCAVRDLFPFSGAAEISDEDRSNFERANAVEVRNGVFISRISGSVAGGGVFDQEMVPAGVFFYGEIALQNYQAWQLGLLMSGLQQLDDGFAQLGSSKSRGLGVVRVKLLRLVHEQRAGAQDGPVGVGALVDASTQRAYGLLAESGLPKTSHVPYGLSRRFEVDAGPPIERWKDSSMKALGGLLTAAKGGA